MADSHEVVAGKTRPPGAVVELSKSGFMFVAQALT